MSTARTNWRAAAVASALCLVLIVTIASGVTVPSALSAIGISPLSTLAVPTGIGPVDWKRPVAAGW